MKNKGPPEFQEEQFDTLGLGLSLGLGLRSGLGLGLGW